MTKMMIALLAAANLLVLAGIARADDTEVTTFTPAVVRHAAPLAHVSFDMVQVCDASLTHCTVRTLGATADRSPKASLKGTP